VRERGSVWIRLRIKARIRVRIRVIVRLVPLKAYFGHSFGTHLGISFKSTTSAISSVKLLSSSTPSNIVFA